MDTPIPAEYRNVEEHIRRAHLERAAVIGELIGNAAHALWNGVSQIARTVLGSLSAARDARTVEADVLLNRIVMR